MSRASITGGLFSWFLMGLVLFSGCLILRIPAFNAWFLSGQIILMFLAVFFCRRFSAFQLSVIRTLTGLLFVFSGFVKGVDPVGTQLRIEDYFTAFGTEWATPLALTLSVMLNAVEFILGMLLLFHIRFRLTIWLVLLMMAFFTATTINDALYNPVPDCGCFGDFIIMTNWQTLYKNLVIDSFVIILFLARNRMQPWFAGTTEAFLATLSAACFFFLEIHSIRHLPPLDFRDWKVGKRMVLEERLPMNFYLTFRNRVTGEEREYQSPDYPYSDSAWMQQWEFVSQRVEDPNPRTHELVIEGLEGYDLTANYIENPGLQFICVAYDLGKANLKRMADLRELARQSDEQGISFIFLTSSLPETAETFRHTHHLDAEFYYADDTVLKAMIRSNPGLILMKDAVVLGKWHFNDLPSFAEIMAKFGSP
ncbi:MAG: DoxX family protein [Bacteroidales bacterium]|nr:DoxX family protein [Bacteroidales bacterium]